MFTLNLQNIWNVINENILYTKRVWLPMDFYYMM